jgi:hypothetical protein
MDGPKKAGRSPAGHDPHFCGRITITRSIQAQVGQVIDVLASVDDSLIVRTKLITKLTDEL